jgi:hypothetical protein
MYLFSCFPASTYTNVSHTDFTFFFLTLQYIPEINGLSALDKSSKNGLSALDKYLLRRNGLSVLKKYLLKGSICRAGGRAQVVQHLPINCKALNLKPRNTQKEVFKKHMHSKHTSHVSIKEPLSLGISHIPVQKKKGTGGVTQAQRVPV